MPAGGGLLEVVAKSQTPPPSTAQSLSLVHQPVVIDGPKQKLGPMKVSQMSL
jgi:hypothetical protein